MNTEPTRQPGKLERQRDAAVDHVIRFGGGFGWSNRSCHACSSKLTAKTPGGAWCCPWDWPVGQLELGA